MATPIRIKRSAVPCKRPQTTDLQVGELALNTYDAELVTLGDRSAAGIATEVVRVGSGVTVSNVLYVTKYGNDNNYNAQQQQPQYDFNNCNQNYNNDNSNNYNMNANQNNNCNN